MTGKERVRRAMRFEKPDRVPIFYFNEDKDKSDIFVIDVEHNFQGEGQDISEWGFVWERKDGTMGQPIAPVINDWSELDAYKAPEVDAKNRFSPVKAQLDKLPVGQYKLASLQLTGFTIMSFLRGFAQLMEDLALEPELCGRLADTVFGFETSLFPYLGELGFDGVAFYDDWGTQDKMIISPNMWRSMFKQRYKAQFDAAHEAGLDVYFHTCGQVTPIIGDLIEAGVDMLNISQPNLYDMAELGGRFGGKVCFVCPVSYQTTSILGTREEIFRDVRALVDNLGRFGGGLIGYIEEYSSMGMSRNNYHSCEDAFIELGGYEA